MAHLDNGGADPHFNMKLVNSADRSSRSWKDLAYKNRVNPEMSFFFAENATLALAVYSKSLRRFNYTVVQRRQCWKKYDNVWLYRQGHWCLGRGIAQLSLFDHIASFGLIICFFRNLRKSVQNVMISPKRKINNYTKILTK